MHKILRSSGFLFPWIGPWFPKGVLVRKRQSVQENKRALSRRIYSFPLQDQDQALEINQEEPQTDGINSEEEIEV